EVQVAAQTTQTPQPAPTPGASVVTAQNRQGHGTRARLIRYETATPPLEELKDRAIRSAAGIGPIPKQGAMASAPGSLSGYAFNPYLGKTFSGTPNTRSLTFDGLVEGQAASGA